MHSLEARPKAYVDTRRKRMRPYTGASPLTCRPQFNIGRISRERLVSVMLNCLCQLRLDWAAVSSKPPYHFRSRGTRDPTVACGSRRLPTYVRFTVLCLCSFHFRFPVRKRPHLHQKVSTGYCGITLSRVARTRCSSCACATRILSNGSR